VLFFAWTVFGVLSSAHFIVADRRINSIGAFFSLADEIIVFYWAWAILTPVVLYAARRAARGNTQGLRRWAPLALTGLLVVPIHGMLHIALRTLFGVEHTGTLDARGLMDYAVRHGGGDLATFAVLVGGMFLFEANRRARQRELAAAALESRLARANLELLRWRLHPHFLFNTLNTLSTLMLKGDTDRGERAISLIARYLRDALAQTADETVPLDAELAAVARYLEIEQLRFGDSMRMEIDATEAARRARVPGQLVQPLVENAIMHGASRSPGAEMIAVTASVSGDRLLITISNPAFAVALVEIPAPERVSGSEPLAEEGARFGVRYVRERLQQFYGDDARFELRTVNGRTTASLDLPYSRLPAEGSALSAGRGSEAVA
jgi:hypothetical protein